MHNRTTILATGLNGLVGSKFRELYQHKYQFDSLDLRDPQEPVDITNYNQVIDRFSTSSAQVIIHLAAFTNVTEAWKQKGDKSGLAYQVNVEGTRNIIKACQETQKALIHISTAYVFAGTKAGLYTEQDQPQPIEWYGQTKLVAEELVQASATNWTILRIDQPFRPDPFLKTDYAHFILKRLTENQLYPMFTDHFFGPTYINDFARVLEFFIRTGNTGLYHATSGEKWSDYQFALAIKDALKLTEEVKRGSLEDYLKTLNRPYQKNTALDCTKLFKILDFKPTSIKTALKQLEL